jgi:lipoprotein-anchoring transpeptidase ErfK/SrfK
MNANTQAAHEAIKLARQAQLRGEKRTARSYAEQAVRLAPEIEEGWLMLAAVASPHASVAYLEQALRINPNSERAHKGMHWAISRLRDAAETQPSRPRAALPAPEAAGVTVARHVPLTPTPHHERKPVPGAIATRRISTALILVIVLCAALGVAALSGIASPAISAPLGVGWAVLRGRPAQTQATIPAVVADLLQINQPTYTPLPTETPTPLPTSTPTPIPTDTPTPLPTNTLLPPPPMVVYEATPLPTDSVSAESVPSHGGERWIDVDLTNQMVYAYDGNTLVNSFLVSTGTWEHPTVTGQYHIWIKLRYTRMTGPGYDLPNVPYTMYFYKGYGLHGTYWHSNFGTPMSHGCVNLSIPDAEWLYNWASEGTLVNVHY